MCWLHIEVVVNWVDWVCNPFKKLRKKLTMNEFLFPIDVCFFCNNSILITEIREKYHRLCNEILQRDSNIRIFIWENFILRILQNPILILSWTSLGISNTIEDNSNVNMPACSMQNLPVALLNFIFLTASWWFLWYWPSDNGYR